MVSVSKKILLFQILLSIWSISCTFDNEEERFSGETCDTLNVDYEKIKNIFANNCSDCHFEGNTFNPSVVLTNYEGIKEAIANDRLSDAINHREGVTPMPYGKTQLPNCELQKINVWIKNGTSQ